MSACLETPYFSGEGETPLAISSIAPDALAQDATIEEPEILWHKKISRCQIKTDCKKEGSGLKGEELLFVPSKFLDTLEGIRKALKELGLPDDIEIPDTLVKQLQSFANPRNWKEKDYGFVFVVVKNSLRYSRVPMIALEPFRADSVINDDKTIQLVRAENESTVVYLDTGAKGNPSTLDVTHKEYQP